MKWLQTPVTWGHVLGMFIGYIIVDIFDKAI